ncbi:MAG: phage tail protein [Leptospirales bacterium]|nr:phage tail protein [Leptospirales bacterium]
MGRRQLTEHLKAGIFRGVGFGIGLSAAGLFAAAAAMNVFSAGQTISASQINQNFAIAAPEGAVVAFYLTSCPEGWAPADGTNGTPDLRGHFIRGRDDAGTGPAGNDPGGSRAIGNLQADAFQGHRMFRNTSNVTEAHVMISGGGSDMQGAAGTLNISFSAATTGDPTTDGTNGTPRIANESRPKNVALTYCMRKNS